MKSYGKAIRRINARIPEGAIECLPGCTLCCTGHAWTWTEWEKVEDKRVAKSKEARCPYAGPQGCECYEDRPSICRMFGLCEEPVKISKYPRPISFGCKLGIKPKHPLTVKEISELLFAYLTIIQSELIDGHNEGFAPFSAGPYSPFVGKRAEQKEVLTKEKWEKTTKDMPDRLIEGKD